ncbi:MAG: hypothetical protein CL930_16575 [Deltaproteobacteria bacterium]|nr:hypothetical protein [Deltaproteobacteria bacterium]
MHLDCKLSIAFGLLLTWSGCSKEYEIIPTAPEVDPGAVMECPFTPISDTKMSVYDCNPVFDGTGESWGESVGSVGFYANSVLGHSFYQIWYSGSEDSDEIGGDWGVGTAISSNGTDWEPHPENPLLESIEDAWNQDGMSAMQVVRDSAKDQYVMAYQGYLLDEGILGLGVATSSDGVRWEQHEDNPVVDLSADHDGLNWCWPLGIAANERGGITGYLGGGESGSTFGTPVCNVYRAQVSDLSDWDILDDPALEAGPESYDQAGVSAASVVKAGDTHYMFYVGFSDWEPISIGGFDYIVPTNQTLNLATSTSGISWTKHPDNPLPVHLTPEGNVTGVAAQVVDTRIHLWITDEYEELGRSAVGYYYYEPEIADHP